MANMNVKEVMVSSQIGLKSLCFFLLLMTLKSAIDTEPKSLLLFLVKRRTLGLGQIDACWFLRGQTFLAVSRVIKIAGNVERTKTKRITKGKRDTRVWNAYNHTLHVSCSWISTKHPFFFFWRFSAVFWFLSQDRALEEFWCEIVVGTCANTKNKRKQWLFNYMSELNKFPSNFK